MKGLEIFIIREAKMKNIKLTLLLFSGFCFLISSVSMAIEQNKTPLQPQRNTGIPSQPGGGGGGCIPVTCEQAKAYCGNLSDGCGKVLDCGIAKNVTLTVDPPQYTGLCPKTFRFTGSITTDKKGTAQYLFSHPPFVHKDGLIVFNGPGTQQVVYEWSVPHSIPSDQHWLSFSACGAPSVKAVFTVKCINIKPVGGNLPTH